MCAIRAVLRVPWLQFATFSVQTSQQHSTHGSQQATRCRGAISIRCRQSWGWSSQPTRSLSLLCRLSTTWLWATKWLCSRRWRRTCHFYRLQRLSRCPEAHLVLKTEELSPSWTRSRWIRSGSGLRTSYVVRRKPLLTRLHSKDWQRVRYGNSILFEDWSSLVFNNLRRSRKLCSGLLWWLLCVVLKLF